MKEESRRLSKLMRFHRRQHVSKLAATVKSKPLRFCSSLKVKFWARNGFYYIWISCLPLSVVLLYILQMKCKWCSLAPNQVASLHFLPPGTAQSTLIIAHCWEPPSSFFLFWRQTPIIKSPRHYLHLVSARQWVYEYGKMFAIHSPQAFRRPVRSSAPPTGPPIPFRTIYDNLYPSVLRHNSVTPRARNAVQLLEPTGWF